MSNLLLALACGLALLSVVQAQTVCPRLNQTAQSSVAPSCSAISDCTGLTCANSNLGWNVRLSVRPCTDPVVVDVTVTPNGGNPATFVFKELGQQQQGNIAINLLRYRNASHIFVQLTSATSETLIPSVFIPLTPGVCMCNSIKSIIEAAPSSATCVKNANCTGTLCTAHFGAGLVTVKTSITIFPCTVPPSFEMAIFDSTNRQLFRQSFSNSQLANVSGINLDFLGISNIRLNVTLIENEYSEIIQVDALYSSGKLTVLPRQQVILDKTNCVPPTPPTQSGSPFTSETCSRLQKIAAGTGLIFSCSVESGCSGLTCRGLNHRMDLTIIPCASPPAFNVMLFNSSNALIYNKNITNQTTIPVTAGVGINVQVKESQDGVRMKASLEPTDTAIIPYTDIPLNRCQCTNIFCNFTTSSLPPSQAPPTITKSQPSSTPRASPHTGSSNSIIIVSISVPLLVVIAILIAVTVVIIVVVFLRRFRSQRQFTFQQMSSINTDGQEDEEGYE